MSSPEKRTFSLPAVQAQYIDSLIESGTYASGSEVVRAGLRALQERDRIIERWLSEDAASAYDSIQANPGRAIPPTQFFRPCGPGMRNVERNLREVQGFFSPEAQTDLLDLYDYIAQRSGSARALSYIERIEEWCRSLQRFQNGGTVGTMYGQECG